MNFLKRTTVILLLVSIVFYTGCKSVGKSSGKEATARAKVENVDALIGSNLRDKFDQLSSIHYGVEYALSKESDPSKNVVVARDLNSRAMSLSGVPSIEEVKNMRVMIDNLTSELNTEVERGKHALELKDIEINGLQLESQALVSAKDAEIRKYMKLAADTAAKADVVQEELDKMNRFFGLGAVVYGLKRFLVSAAWILGIGSILYLFLRFASMSNPIAASIFSIFDQVMSWFVNLIRVLAPKALSVAGQVSSEVADKYKRTMFKMVDNIEALKSMQKKDPSKKYTIDEFLMELEKALNDDEKKMVDTIKRDIGY